MNQGDNNAVCLQYQHKKSIKLKKNKNDKHRC